MTAILGTGIHDPPRRTRPSGFYVTIAFHDNGHAPPYCLETMDFFVAEVARCLGRREPFFGRDKDGDELSSH